MSTIAQPIRSLSAVISYLTDAASFRMRSIAKQTGNRYGSPVLVVIN